MQRGFMLCILILQGCEASGQVFKAHLSEAWYPHNPSVLKNMLKQLDEEAIHTVFKKAEANRIVGLIVPHAGYQYSGAVAASGYRQIDRKKVKRVIILAPSHSTMIRGVALPFFDTYQTSLGNLLVDTICIQRLKQNKLFSINKDVWNKEHSLEVQLPFIQFYMNKNVRIVPLIIGSASLKELNEISQILKQCIDQHTLIIVSSDFIHHGIRFGYAPFEQDVDVQQSIKNLDAKIISMILQKTAFSVDDIIHQTGATICGSIPILLFKLLQENKAFSNGGAALIDYRTSYAVTRDPINSVSYASIIFVANDFISETEQKDCLSAARSYIEQSCGAEKKEYKNILKNTGFLKQRRGVFVTLYKKGELRGCIGRIEPDKPLYQLIPEIALLSAFNDTRFSPVTCDELKDISISISILTPPQKVAGYQDIIVGVHGVILRIGDKSALFLPKVALEQGWNKETMLMQLARKAGDYRINAWQDPNAQFEVFETIDFSE